MLDTLISLILLRDRAWLIFALLFVSIGSAVGFGIVPDVDSGDLKDDQFNVNRVIKLPKTDKTFNVAYRGHVTGLDNGLMQIYSFNLDQVSNIMEKDITVVVTANFEHNVSEKPLHVTLAYQDTVSAMKIPDEAPSTYPHQVEIQQITTRLTARRTLCLKNPHLNSTSDSDTNFGFLRITIHTENQKRVDFTLRTSVSRRQEIRLNEEFVVSGLARNSPRIFPFQFQPSPSAYLNVFKNWDENLMIRVDSEDNICLTFSIQKPECPVRDDEDNVGYQGWWQTMSRTGAMTVSRAIPEFHQGFYIVLVVHRDDKLCYPPDAELSQQQQKQHETEKNVKITITTKNDEHGSLFRLFHIFLPCLIFVTISLIALCIFKSDCYRTRLKRKFPRAWDSEMQPIHETFIDSAKLYKKSIFITDFNEYNVKELERRQGSYFTTVFVSSLFYTIPVYQLIIHNVVTLHRTGELDLCYFNYLCAHPAGWIFDFNHVWSNIGYIIFGLAFIIIVKTKKFVAWTVDVERLFDTANVEGQLPNTFRLPNGKVDYTGWFDKPKFYKFLHQEGNEQLFRRWRIIRDHGIPPHTHGLDQALGFSLMMEGFLSAAYHLCPNQSNFQYDTNFMYIMCILGLVKVYQFRHPVHPDSNNVFRLLAAFCLVSVIGLAADYSQNETFRQVFKIGFSLIHFLSIFYSSIYKYGLGHIKERNSQGKITNIILTHWNPKFWSLPPFFPFDGDWRQVGSIFKQFFQRHMRSRSLALISSLAVNAVLISSYIMTNQNFADHFLFVLMANFILSTIVYVSHKISLEKSYKVNGASFYNNCGFLLWQPFVYLVLCLVFGVAALICFTSRVTNWETVPAISRNENKACDETVFSIDRYYDSHDYWHFLSSIMLFSGFMVNQGETNYAADPG